VKRSWLLVVGAMTSALLGLSTVAAAAPAGHAHTFQPNYPGQSHWIVLSVSAPWASNGVRNECGVILKEKQAQRPSCRKSESTTTEVSGHLGVGYKILSADVNYDVHHTTGWSAGDSWKVKAGYSGFTWWENYFNVTNRIKQQYISCNVVQPCKHETPTNDTITRQFAHPAFGITIHK
jgi:hypothetical protein